MSTKTGKKIRAAIILKGTTGAELAKKIRVTRGAINMVIKGIRRTSRLRRFISSEVGLPTNIWAEMDRELKALKEAKSL